MKSPSLLRPYWVDLIRKAHQHRPIVWLSGVRRVGKTTLSKSFTEASYYNCDLPSVQQKLEDPETFLKNQTHSLLIFDEIHQIKNPAQLLKIAADEYSHLKIIATGSSTLAAHHKFKDTLTGRKIELHLVPVLPEEMEIFKIKDDETRFLYGGLPPALLAKEKYSEFYSEWIDSFYARDIQELFKIDKRQPFIELLELLLRQNGGLADVTRFAKEVGLTRPTVIKYIEALETTRTITILRPYHDGKTQEITHQPKIYGFDTGFICHLNGWDQLRPDDLGHLLENIVLESLQAQETKKNFYYWRTKQGKEIDFILKGKNKDVHAIECKWDYRKFDIKNLTPFRAAYPKGENIVVCSNAHSIIRKKIEDLSIAFIHYKEIRKYLASV